MKRKFLRTLAALLALLMLPLGALGEDAPTMEDIVNANLTSVLVSRYGSFLLTVVVEEHEEFSHSVYADDEYVYSNERGNRMLRSSLKESCNYYGPDDTYPDGAFSPMINITGEPYDMSQYEGLVLDAKYTLTETITDSKLEDGSLYLTTKLPIDDSMAYIAQMIEIQEGDYMVNGYQLDPETYVYQSGYMTVYRADGTQALNILVTTELGASRPEQMTEMIAVLEQTTDLRTVTVVSDPGTAEEQTFSRGIPKGCTFDVFRLKEYKLFTDAECTVLFDYHTEDLQGDLTLYTKYVEPVVE